MTVTHAHPEPHGHHHDHAVVVTDPVCGMKVDPATTSHHASHVGHEWHFCSDKCRAKFVADPERYLTPPEPADAPAGTIWTCPMGSVRANAPPDMS